MRARKRLFSKFIVAVLTLLGSVRVGRRPDMGLRPVSCADRRAEFPIQGPGGGGLRATSPIFHRKPGAD